MLAPHLTDAARTLIDVALGLIDATGSLIDVSNALIDASTALIDVSNSLIDVTNALTNDRPAQSRTARRTRPEPDRSASIAVSSLRGEEEHTCGPHTAPS